MSIKDFEVVFTINGKKFSFCGDTITRNVTDGGGNPILSAVVRCEDGSRGVCILTPDWQIVHMYIN